MGRPFLSLSLSPYTNRPEGEKNKYIYIVAGFFFFFTFHVATTTTTTTTTFTMRSDAHLRNRSNKEEEEEEENKTTTEKEEKRHTTSATRFQWPHLQLQHCQSGQEQKNTDEPSSSVATPNISPALAVAVVPVHRSIFLLEISCLLLLICLEAIDLKFSFPFFFYFLGVFFSALNFFFSFLSFFSFFSSPHPSWSLLFTRTYSGTRKLSCMCTPQQDSWPAKHEYNAPKIKK